MPQVHGRQREQTVVQKNDTSCNYASMFREMFAFAMLSLSEAGCLLGLVVMQHVATDYPV